MTKTLLFAALACALFTSALVGCARSRDSGPTCGLVGLECCAPEGDSAAQTNTCLTVEGEGLVSCCNNGNTICGIEYSDTLSADPLGCTTSDECCGTLQCNDGFCCAAEGQAASSAQACCAGLRWDSDRGVCSSKDAGPCGDRAESLCCPDGSCPGENSRTPLVCVGRADTSEAGDVGATRRICAACGVKDAYCCADDRCTDGSVCETTREGFKVCAGGVSVGQPINMPTVPSDPETPRPIFAEPCPTGVTPETCLTTDGCGYCISAGSGTGTCERGNFFASIDSDCRRSDGQGRTWLWSVSEYGDFNSDTCAQATSCAACVNANAQCGWCKNRCVTGTASGPLTAVPGCSVSQLNPSVDDWAFSVRECS